MSWPVGASAVRAPRTAERLPSMVARQGVREIHASEPIVQLGDRSYGVLLLGLALLSIVPNGPGFSGLVGVALMAMTAQLIVGRRAPWLPPFLCRRRLSVARLRRGIDIAARWLRWLERLCRPRRAVWPRPWPRYWARKARRT